MLKSHFIRTFPSLSLALLLLSSCGPEKREGPIAISVIGKKQEIVEPLTHIQSEAGSLVMGATAQGLVRFNNLGEVVPGLAQRWIVVDGGKTYIFRLRRANWTNNQRVDARDVASLLENRLKANARLDPYGTLASVTEVKAMTSDVIEIDLSTPDPDFLSMLAQPRMAIAKKHGGTGPYRKHLSGSVLMLTPITKAVDPNAEYADEASSAQETSRQIRAERAALAAARFDAGDSDIILGGTIADYPIAKAIKAEKRSLRIDPARGLFGLAVIHESPLLKQAEVRHALAMSIDRSAMIALFDIKGWQPQIVVDILSRAIPDWGQSTMEERRNRASAIIDIWKSRNPGKTPVVRLAPGKGPGRRLLNAFLAQQFDAIGVQTVLTNDAPDMELIDEVAPYDSSRWLLGRISCARGVSCDPKAEKMLKDSTLTENFMMRRRLVSEAEGVIIAHGGFIPLANPLRWNLVGRRITGFELSAFAIHPLDGLVATKH